MTGHVTNKHCIADVPDTVVSCGQLHGGAHCPCSKARVVCAWRTRPSCNSFRCNTVSVLSCALEADVDGVKSMAVMACAASSSEPEPSGLPAKGTNKPDVRKWVDRMPNGSPALMPATVGRHTKRAMLTAGLWARMREQLAKSLVPMVAKIELATRAMSKSNWAR